MLQEILTYIIIAIAIAAMLWKFFGRIIFKKHFGKRFGLQSFQQEDFPCGCTSSTKTAAKTSVKKALVTENAAGKAKPTATETNSEISGKCLYCDDAANCPLYKAIKFPASDCGSNR